VCYFLSFITFLVYEIALNSCYRLLLSTYNLNVAIPNKRYFSLTENISVRLFITEQNLSGGAASTNVYSPNNSKVNLKKRQDVLICSAVQVGPSPSRK
jgi:hypothetical protein